MTVMPKILVTGCAGFIGFRVCRRLLESAGQHGEIVGLDNLNSYYDVRLKQARLDLLPRKQQFRFVKLDLADRDHLRQIFETERFENVVNVAAQAGVSYSLPNPRDYLAAIRAGLINLLDASLGTAVEELVIAS